MTVLTQIRRPPRLRNRPVPPEPEKLDKYEYGWRELPRITDDGDVIYVRQPLTLWDVLHPLAGDFRVHSIEHETFLIYLHDVFAAQLADDPTAYVLLDTRVAWARRDIEPHSPDIAVIFGVQEYTNWSTFDEVEMGTKPTLIVEVISPKTRRVDITDKRYEYAQVGVQYYILVDADIQRRRTRYKLIGYELVGNAYQVMPANEHGWLWLEPVQVWIGLHDNWLVCYDVDGNRIGDYVQVRAINKRITKQAEVAEQQAALAEQQAALAEQKAASAQQQAASAQQQAASAQLEAAVAEQRAETAEQRATAEYQARLELEAKLQALAEELRRLKGES